MHHLFFTGDGSIDLQRPLQQLLEKLAPRFHTISGFEKIMVPSAVDGASYEAYLTVLGCAPVCDDDHMIGIQWEDGFYNGFPEVFDHGGLRILDAIPASADLLVMNDIGRYEMAAPTYSARLLHLLDADTPIIGVLQKRETDFFDQVQKHPRVRLFEVTRENYTAAADKAFRGMMA